MASQRPEERAESEQMGSGETKEQWCKGAGLLRAGPWQAHRCQAVGAPCAAAAADTWASAWFLACCRIGLLAAGQWSVPPAAAVAMRRVAAFPLPVLLPAVWASTRGIS